MSHCILTPLMLEMEFPGFWGQYHACRYHGSLTLYVLLFFQREHKHIITFDVIPPY